MKKFTRLYVWLLTMLFASSTMFAQTANSVFNSQINALVKSGNIDQAKSMVVKKETKKYKKVTIDLKGKGEAYAYVAYDPSSTNPTGPAMVETSDASVTSLAATSSENFLPAGTWADGVWYAEEYDNGNLWTIDTDGTMTLVGSGSNSINGMAFDGTTMYGCTSTDLYTIDLSTGAQTLVGSMGNAGGVMIGLASDGTTLYGIDLGDDNLYTIDPSTGAATVVGPLGIDINYAQDAEYDKDNGVLYLAGYTTTGSLYTVDVNTGAATYVADFTGGAEITAFAIPYTGVTYTNDMAMVSITSPNTGVDLSNAETVSVKVKNNGTVDQSNFDVSYTFDGNTYTETITATVAPGEMYEHTFATTVDLSAYGSYDFEASVSLSGDENPANDTKTKTVENLEPSLCIDGLYTTGCSWGDGLVTWDLADVNVAEIPCGNGDPYDWYHDYTDMVHTLAPGNDYTLTAQCGYSNTYLRVWIDFNDNLMTEPDEMLVDNYLMEATGTDYEIPISIPADALQGQHILRYRTNWNSPLDGDGCETYTYGNMCDFSALVGEAPPTFDPPTNLTATAVDQDVELSWENPTDITGIEVYRDGSLISTLGVETTYLDVAPGYGTFTYCVKAIYPDGVSECSDEASATLVNGDLDPVTNLVGSADGGTVTLTWDAPGGGPSPQDFFEDFESGTLPTGWLAVDNDGDGYGWINGAENGFGAYEGTGCMASASYINGVGALTPDNWLITPAIVVGNGATLSYWHTAQDPNWADEYYYVKVSTTGTDLSDFTDVLWEGVTPADWAQVSIDLSAYAGQTCYFAFEHTDVTDMYWMKIDNFAVSGTKTKAQYTAPVAISKKNVMPFKTKDMSTEEIAVALANYNAKSSKDLLSFDVYRDGEFIGNTLNTSYVESGVAPGTHTYGVQAIYDEGPAPMVTVDVTVEAGDYVFYDDFENGVAGDQVACTVNDPAKWTTWDNAPCTSTDAYYSDEQAHNGSISTLVEDDVDLVHPIDNYVSGAYDIDFWMYIAPGKLAYWNTLQLFNGSQSKWGMQIMYQDGTATLDAAGAAATTFAYPDGAWMHNVLHVDLTNDQAELVVDDVSIYTWVWSEGANGGNELDQLGGNDFYGWTGKGKGVCKYFIDEYKIVQTAEPIAPITDLTASEGANCNDVVLSWTYDGCTNLSNYNVYRNADLVGAPSTTGFTDENVPDGTYTYTVKPVCDGNEGPASNAVEVEIACNMEVPEVVDLQGDFNENGDAVLNWQAPIASDVFSHMGDLDPENGIGLTNGGTFSVASRFETGSEYYGGVIDAIEFGPVGDGSATFTLKVWEGNSDSPTEVYAQEVTSYIPGEMNTVELTTPVAINPLKQIWVGYTVTHEAGNNPAGVDAGPAAEGGDLLSFGDTGENFVSMSQQYGLDYNWAVKGLYSFGGSYNVYYGADAGTSYDLLGNTEETTYTHTPSEIYAENYYKVTVLVDDNESEGTVEVISSVEDNVASVTSIYPNPATDKIQINSDLNIENVKVYDVTGRMVSSVNVTGNTVTLDVNDLNGVYMLQITTEKGVMNTKVVVK